MINIGSRKEVFFDDYLIDEGKTTAETVVNRPVARETIMQFDKPWECNTTYVQFFKDGDKFRMYYNEWFMKKFFEKEESEEGQSRCYCYAESKDGIHWEKPNLGIIDWHGNKNNNLILKNEWADNFFVFSDENPNCPPEAKYKALARNDTDTKNLYAYYSKDGVNFEFGRKITDEGNFDSLNICFWDKSVNKYRIFYRGIHYNENVTKPTEEKIDNETLRKDPGSDCIRDVRYIESEDFINWSKPVMLNFGEKEDIQLYTNGVMIYEEAPHILIGFPTIYTERKEWTPCFDELCGKSGRKDKMKYHKRLGLAMTDCNFMVSRDGVNFKRYDEPIFPNGPERYDNWAYGDCYPAVGMLKTPSVFSGADDEISMLVPELGQNENPEQLRRYTIRQDGFCSLHAGEKEKILVTKPFVFEGKNLYANMETSASGYMYYELSDKEGNVAKSCEMFGNRVKKKICFETDLSAFSGKETVLTVKMRNADLYAIQFGE